MSLCDICVDPGACCRCFPLVSGKELNYSKNGNGSKILDVLTGGLYRLPSGDRSYHFDSVPFRPAGIRWCDYDPEEGEERVVYWYGCPLLDHEGRCSEYEKRPSTCQVFRPGGGEICPYHGKKMNLDDRDSEETFIKKGHKYRLDIWKKGHKYRLDACWPGDQCIDFPHVYWEPES